jgi:hypothetical protein
MAKVKLKELKTLKTNQPYFWNKSNRKSLYDDLKENGLNTKKGNIKVTFDNHIIDGHHRHKILMEIYGEDYEIKVIKFPFPKFLYISLLYTILVLSIPILLVVYVYQNYTK